MPGPRSLPGVGINGTRSLLGVGINGTRSLLGLSCVIIFLGCGGWAICYYNPIRISENLAMSDGV